MARNTSHLDDPARRLWPRSGATERHLDRLDRSAGVRPIQQPPRRAQFAVAALTAAIGDQPIRITVLSQLGRHAVHVMPRQNHPTSRNRRTVMLERLLADPTTDQGHVTKPW